MQGEIVERLTARGRAAWHAEMVRTNDTAAADRAFTRAVICGVVLEVRRRRREVEGHGAEFHAPITLARDNDVDEV